MKKGYVYILTNPYFRKGIVKIGKSKNPVDTRSKQLYNTSVPDRFEVYASMSTVKYDSVEKLIHAILTKLSKRRVNEKREFFKIKPAEALDVFQDVAKVIDDAEMVVMGEEKKVSRKPRTRKPSKQTWAGVTQLAKAIADTHNNGKAVGHAVEILSGRFPVKSGMWRNILDRVGVAFDTTGHVIDWSKAKV